MKLLEPWSNILLLYFIITFFLKRNFLLDCSKEFHHSLYYLICLPIKEKWNNLYGVVEWYSRVEKKKAVFGEIKQHAH